MTGDAYRIALVEDDLAYAELLKEYLTRFGSEHDVRFEAVHFKNAVSFLEDYTADYDLVLMDIQMPYLNGMDAAAKLRTLDPTVLLIFITNLAQYAIRGYEVDALDYILKPVTYAGFSLKITRALKRMSRRERRTEVLIPTKEGKIRVALEDIRYIESSDHYVLYHTKEEIYRQYATMSSVEQRLSDYPFARCNNCYLVNLAYVEKVKGFSVTVGGEVLQMSQTRKKEFLQRLTEYLESR